MMTPDRFLQELELAMREYRFLDAGELIQRIDPTPFTLKQIRKSLNLLRRKRQFSALERLAGMFFMASHPYPVIRRQWAQSLLDQNRIAQALTALRDAASQFAADPEEGPEIRGLIGRAYKQIYINEGGAENLASAIAAYSDDWTSPRKSRWHGINLVALSQRALDDGVAATRTLEPKAVAREILEDIDDHGAGGYWDFATAMEASIALDDEEAALSWLKKYVHHPDTDAFEIASTLRQLKEVWRAERLPIGAEILPVLEHALLQREGGCTEPTKVSLAAAAVGFEAVYGAESYTYMAWMDSLQRCCLGVARIHDRNTGAPWGTGFLLHGRTLKDSWGDAPVLLTNSHVVSVDPVDEAPLRPDDAAAEFTRLDGRPKVALGDILYSSPRTHLDATIMRLTPPAASVLFEHTTYAPTITTDAADPQRVYVIGHPNGGELAVSMYDNSLVEHVDQFIRYRSPTDPGNSGSPVCTRQLKSFAIHHRALADRQLNEGIWLASIKAAL